MTVIPAVFTDKAREKWPKFLGGILSPFKLISFFRVGEGGWIDPGSGRVPRTPDPTLTDLDIILDASRLPGDKRYNVGENMGYFQKSLVGGDFSFVSPSILRASCLLINSEYNLENDGTLVYDVGGPYVSPDIYEIGLYDQDNDMIAYGTFEKETKSISVQIENIVRVIF